MHQLLKIYMCGLVQQYSGSDTDKTDAAAAFVDITKDFIVSVNNQCSFKLKSYTAQQQTQ